MVSGGSRLFPVLASTPYTSPIDDIKAEFFEALQNESESRPILPTVAGVVKLSIRVGY